MTEEEVLTALRDEIRALRTDIGFQKNDHRRFEAQLTDFDMRLRDLQRTVEQLRDAS
jgi:hypothetical protein